MKLDAELRVSSMSLVLRRSKIGINFAHLFEKSLKCVALVMIQSMCIKRDSYREDIERMRQCRELESIAYKFIHFIAGDSTPRTTSLNKIAEVSGFRCKCARV